MQQQADLIIQLAKKQAVKADVSIVKSKGFSVSARGGKVDTVENCHENSLSLTVYADGKTGSASTTDLSTEALQKTFEKALSFASFASVDPCSGLADKQKLAQQIVELELNHPWEITPAEAIEKAIECESLARQQDSRINDSEGASVNTYQTRQAFATTDDFYGEFVKTMHSINCSVVAEADGEKQRDYEYSCARDPKALLDVSLIGQQAAEKTLARLGSRKLPTQQCPVIFHASVARGLFSSLISAISGGNLYRKSSFLLDSLHTSVFPSFISIYQRPHLLGGLASAPYDAEGVATKNQHYVKDGELVSYALGSYSARKLNMETTGNAGGVFNLIVTTEDSNLKALFKKMRRGLFITELMGQGVRLVTGDYSRGAAGFWIEDGEIAFPVSEITVSGNLRNMFHNIVAIGNDVDHRGNIQTGSVLIDNMTIAGD